MSCDNIIPEFEVFLADEKVNKMLEFLIRDSAFSIEFLASTIAHYYLTNKEKNERKN